MKQANHALDAAALYWCDNGRVACGEHAGTSALYTGITIAGQPVERVTAVDVAAWPSDLPPIACETCKRGVS